MITDIPAYLEKLDTMDGAIQFYGDISDRCKVLHEMIRSIIDGTIDMDKYADRNNLEVVRKRLGK